MAANPAAISARPSSSPTSATPGPVCKDCLHLYRAAAGAPQGWRRFNSGGRRRKAARKARKEARKARKESA